jgi:hypothetical protein
MTEAVCRAANNARPYPARSTMYNSAQPAVGRDAMQPLEAMFAEHAAVRQLIMSHLGCRSLNAHALRQVSRAIRVAVNHDVSTVACDLTAPRFEADVVTVFPAATKLRISGPDRYGAEISGPDRYGAELDVCILLEYILATSPALVTKLVALTLSLGVICSFKDVAPAVADFLSRYAQVSQS